MKFDSTIYPYASRRNVQYAKNGMVATGSPLAAEAGLEILKKGGNAIDAAIATAVALTVVEPTGCGIGGDAFAIISIKDKIFGLNSTGSAPMSLNANELFQKGFKEMPKYGLIPVTVPGIPKAWHELSKKFGKLSLEEVMQPAIKLAEEGYAISVNVGKLWKKGYENFKKEKGEEFKYWFETFAPNDKVPNIGDIVYLKDHAKTLKILAKTNCQDFYSGDLANKIDEFSKKYGGYIRKSDLENFEVEWVNPISVKYRGYDVYEIPPNGHGISALMALNILDQFEFSDRETIETYHKMIEAMKLAFVDTQKYVADPKYMSVSVEELLSKKYATERARLIGDTAIMPEAGNPKSGGTVYLAVADNEGNMISYIQSNYMGFGSGMVVPNTGISLHNRGNNFYLDEKSPNNLEPGKKPYHTIIPGFLAKDGKAIGPFGVMGGFMQPQGHVQVVTNTIDFMLNPQSALDAPRWQWIGGKIIELEASVPNHIAYGLSSRGHDIKVIPDSLMFGRGQIIWRLDNGVLCGGTEPRTDGAIALW
ncbi:MAG: gamma-glutamyltransferase [Fusobacteriaceae bacterium]